MKKLNGRTSLAKLATLTVVCFSLVGVSNANVAAATQTRPDSSRAVLAVPGVDLPRAVISRYDRYVTEDTAGRFIARVPASVAAADPAGTQSVRRAVDRANSTVGFVLDQGNAKEQAGGAHGGLKKHWWGVELWLDKAATDKVTAAMTAGAGAAGIAATLAAEGVISSPGALPAGVAAGILAIGSGAIGLCASSEGVVLHLAWTGTPWCTGK